MFLSTNRIISLCRHDWKFAAGGDYGILRPARSCALGRGQELWRAIDSKEAVGFLDMLYNHARQTNEFTVWLRRLLDPDASPRFGRSALARCAKATPNRGFCLPSKNLRNTKA